MNEWNHAQENPMLSIPQETLTQLFELAEILTAQEPILPFLLSDGNRLCDVTLDRELLRSIVREIRRIDGSIAFIGERN